MNIYKKLIIAAAFGASLLMTLTPTLAAAVSGEPAQWDLRGAYTVDFHCDTGVCAGQTTTHTMTFAEENFSNGDFFGQGVYTAGPNWDWNIKGRLEDNNLTNISIVYTTGQTESATGKGKINPSDGSLSGTAKDASNTFSWHTTTGKANYLKLNDKKELNKDMCNLINGLKDPIIDVKENVKNDFDSGIAGNFWGLENFSRHIQVWNVGGTNYCGLITDEGDFRGITGEKSPGQSFTGSILKGTEKGDFYGGERFTFTGNLDLSDTAHWPLRGTVSPNPLDLHCDTNPLCPGTSGWKSNYFDSITNDNLAWWGWIYKGDHNSGTWVNASDIPNTSLGDILDPVNFTFTQIP